MWFYIFSVPIGKTQARTELFLTQAKLLKKKSRTSQKKIMKISNKFWASVDQVMDEYWSR